jgi:aryl-alcohol dehydrogenase-like predicted oxidoreductase
MKYARMGDTGLIVSRVSLGTMTFGSGKTGKYAALASVGEKEAAKLVALALDAGVNSFNSAATYSGGESEIYLGKALGGRRANVVVTTKAGFETRSSTAAFPGAASSRPPRIV